MTPKEMTSSSFSSELTNKARTLPKTSETNPASKMSSQFSLLGVLRLDFLILKDRSFDEVETFINREH